MICAKECIGGTWIEQNFFFLHVVVVLYIYASKYILSKFICINMRCAKRSIGGTGTHFVFFFHFCCVHIAAREREII